MESERVLVDTNIFLDYYLNRTSGILPIGKFAFGFITSAVKCNYTFIVCIETIWEISSVLAIAEEQVVENVLMPIKEKNKLEVIAPIRTQKIEAHNLSQKLGVPYVDALLAVVAKSKNIRIVTRDSHFFEKLSTLVDCAKSEELY